MGKKQLVRDNNLRLKSSVAAIKRVHDSYFRNFLNFLNEYDLYSIIYLCNTLRLACPTAQREMTAVVAEILMYVLIVVLQLWLILVLVYCYKKISAEQEAREARKALKNQTKYALVYSLSNDHVSAPLLTLGKRLDQYDHLKY